MTNLGAVPYSRLVERLAHGAPFVSLLGAEIVGVGHGTSEVHLSDREDVLNAVGTVHAGALFSLADIAAGVAVYGLMASVVRLREVQLTTGASRMSYVRPAKGALVATARVAGDLVQLLETWTAQDRLSLDIDVRVTAGGDPKPVATSNVTCLVRRDPS